MGFKRTAEGRVYFESPEDSSQNAGGANDLQIAGLLRALNERLKDAQAERARLMRELGDFRDLIDDLGERTARSEQAFIDLEQKVALTQDESFKKAERAERAAKETLNDILEARNSMSELLDKSEDGEKTASALRLQLSENKKIIDEMRKRQAILEKLQKEQGEKMVDHVAAYVSMSKRINAAESRYVTLDNKIEEANSRQLQLDRKFEKAKEDRVRLLRKIDRIEETVIQMRDTLNAKAMVVLADPNAASGALPPRAGAEALQPPPFLAREPVVVKQRDGDELPSWWSKNFKIPAGAATIVIAVVIMGSLIALMELSAPDGAIGNRIAGFLDDNKWRPVAEGNAVVQSQLVEPEALVMDVQQELRARREQERQQEADRLRAAAGFAQGIETETAPEQPAPVANAAPDPADDIGAIDLNDEQQLLAALEQNPDALAARLNEIEPGTETEAAAPAESVQKIAKAEAAAPVQKQSAPERTRTTLAERISPDPNLPPAIKEIEIQAFTGAAEAQHDLAAIYTAGHGGVKVNYERAAMWFHESAENGIANARYNLGVLYHQGLGVERSLEDAIKWYQAAADMGHPEAQYNLGIAYIEGIGVPYDPKKASTYFENAANAGITEAAYNLGLIHENGLLGQAKPDEALRWYKTAADKGSPEAKAALEQLAKTLNIGIDEINALAEKVKEGKAQPAAAPVAPAQKLSSVVRQDPPEAQAAPQPLTPVATPVSTAATESDAYDISGPEQQRRLTAKVQSHLMRLGLYPGPADGASGPLTTDAIRSYQALSGLDTDGKPSQALLNHMNADAELGSRYE